MRNSEEEEHYTEMATVNFFCYCLLDKYDINDLFKTSFKYDP